HVALPISSACRRSDRLSSFVHTPSHLHKALYQEALITPGTSPARASLRKQMRHSLNFRKKPRGRPQRKQRLRCLQLNLGVPAALALASISSLAILAVVAMFSPARSLYCARNGIPICFNNARPSASVLALVVIQIFIPLALSTF